MAEQPIIPILTDVWRPSSRLLMNIQSLLIYDGVRCKELQNYGITVPRIVYDCPSLALKVKLFLTCPSNIS
jgi:hypothetical protein